MKPFYLLAVFFIFSITVTAQQLAPQIEWSKLLGGTADERGYAIVQAWDGGYVLAGVAKSNNGDLTGHYGTATTNDGWVVKISAVGNIEWQKNFGGALNDEFRNIIRTQDGNYICYGYTSSTDGDIVDNKGAADIWIMKIDRYGNKLWSKCYGGTSSESGGNIRELTDGSLLFGATTASNNGDVSGNNGTNDVWVVKLDSDGIILSQKCWGGTLREELYDIMPLPTGGYMLSATTLSQDGDLGPAFDDPYGVVLSVNSNGVAVNKEGRSRATPISLTLNRDNSYTAIFNLNNCYPMNPNNGINPRRITFNPANDQIGMTDYLSYSFCESTGDVSTGYWAQERNSHISINATDHIVAGAYQRTEDADASTRGFISSFKSNGSVNWNKFIGGPGQDVLLAVLAISETEFLVMGYTNSNAGDVTGNHGGNDVWITKLGKTNLVKGSVYADYNLDGAKNGNEPYVNNLLIQTEKSGTQVSSLTHDGLFSNAVDTGNWVTKVLTPLQYYNIVPASQPSSFTTYNNVDSFSFAMQPIVGKRDYRVELYPVDILRPGFEANYKLHYFNVGTDTLTNREVTLILDPKLNFTSSNPVPTSISGDTIRWLIPTLSPRDTGNIYLLFTADAPPGLNIDDSVNVQAMIDTTGDLDHSNNFTSVLQIARGSYDPNDKQESHGGIIAPPDVTAGKGLIYTVRFQNTGTDTAFNIIIRDTLDVNLDWSSIQMMDASHPYTFSVKNGRYCTWTFNKILLPDSNVNEPLSHGYIVYRIKPKSTLVIGDEVKNSASIYFDFNLPVLTNTVVTQVKPAAPPAPIITGLLANYCNLVGVQSAKIANLPATGSGITVTVKINGSAVGVGADSTFSFNVTTLNSGTQNVSVEYSNVTANRVSAEQFTVTEAIEPNVNLSANVTTITNLATPVIVTAVNAAGGGATPLYTFARDRNFTNIVQAESNGNTWTFNAAILSVGDNEIFVRMKSNATCIISNTVLDSILLVRSSVTGITDPDMPGQVINIYPNPFKDAITINGLSTSKTYTVRLFNFEGKELISKRVSGRTSIALTRQHQATGIYWLSIFDEKNKKLLGTVKMIKE